MVREDHSDLLDAVDEFDALVMLHWADPDPRIPAIAVVSYGPPFRVLLHVARDVEAVGETDFRILPHALAALGLAHSSTDPHQYVIAPRVEQSAHGGMLGDDERGGRGPE